MYRCVFRMTSIERGKRLIKILIRDELITEKELARLEKIEQELDQISEGIGKSVVGGALSGSFDKESQRGSIGQLMPLLAEKKDLLKDIIQRSKREKQISEELKRDGF